MTVSTSNGRERANGCDGIQSGPHLNGTSDSAGQAGSTSRPLRIILDTDLAMGAGADIDDGFALALAHADPALQIDLITTVHGNTDMESATILTGVLANRLGITVPIIRGAATPLLRPDEVRTPAEHVLALRKEARPPTPGIASMAIVEHILAHPGEITVVAIGPLTNIALAIALDPRIRHAIKELVIMGGIFLSTMPSRDMPGEFNVFGDPEAARIVLRSGLNQRWVGLDVTRQVRLTRLDAQRLRDSDSPFASFAGKAAIEWIDHLAKKYPRRPGVKTSCAMHDSLAVGVVSRPELCEFQEMTVSVVTGETEARGMMIVDRHESADSPESNCKVAVTVNSGAFNTYFLDHILSL